MIVKMKQAVIFIMLVLPFTLTFSQEKVGTTHFQFLKVTPFAKANSGMCFTWNTYDRTWTSITRDTRGDTTNIIL